jgi:hypothetical protein
VHDVGTLAAQRPDQLHQRPQITADAGRSGEAVDRDMTDAARLERGDVVTGRRHPDHLVPGVVERSQLRAE